MTKQCRWVGLLLLALYAHPVAAAPEAVVYCGSFPCVRLRTEAAGRTAEERADWAMNLLNKYLGGHEGRFTLLTRGKDVQLLLNGEVMLAVTPADARSERAKSPMDVAKRWRASLNTAFIATRAVR